MQFTAYLYREQHRLVLQFAAPIEGGLPPSRRLKKNARFPHLDAAVSAPYNETCRRIMLPGRTGIESGECE